MRLTLAAVFVSITLGPAYAAEEVEPDLSYENAPYVIAGVPRIVKADTLAFGREKVILGGLQSPDRNQTCRDKVGRPFQCGRMAAEWLENLIDNQQVECRGSIRNRHGELIALCRLDDGTTLNSEVVRRGWGVAQLRYSKRYEAEQNAARQEMIGIWRARQNEPEVGRRLQGDPEYRHRQIQR